MTFFALETVEDRGGPTQAKCGQLCTSLKIHEGLVHPKQCVSATNKWNVFSFILKLFLHLVKLGG